MSAGDIGTARNMARDIIRQVVQDEAFAERLRNDPRATLLGAGFPDWAIDDFMAYDLGLEEEVSGYQMDRCAVSVSGLLGVDSDGLDSQ